MWRSVEDFQRNRGWKRLFAVACILLVLFASSAELIHQHEAGRIHTDCSLCVTAHSAVQATVYTFSAVPLRQVARLADAQPLFVRRQCNIRLSIRPPPFSAAVA